MKAHFLMLLQELFLNTPLGTLSLPGLYICCQNEISPQEIPRLTNETKQRVEALPPRLFGIVACFGPLLAPVRPHPASLISRQSHGAASCSLLDVPCRSQLLTTKSCPNLSIVDDPFLNRYLTHGVSFLAPSWCLLFLLLS
jgi:hypothetical protein